MPTEKKYEEATLLALLEEDSEYAFQVIFDRHKGRIYRLALLYVKSQSLAEDIVQDVFLKLWFQRKKLSEIKSLESWIYTIAKNHTLNCLKKLASEWTLKEALGYAPSPLNDTTDHKIRMGEYEELLKQAIEQLPAQQKRIYCMAKEKELSYAEIGTLLSLSPLTVKTHMARALASIRNFLRNHDAALVAFVVSTVRFLTC